MRVMKIKIADLESSQRCVKLDGELNNLSNPNFSQYLSPLVSKHSLCSSQPLRYGHFPITRP